MNTVKRGDLTVFTVISRLLKEELDVSKPISENNRYDLIVDNKVKLYKVQVKTIYLYKKTNTYCMNCFSAYQTNEGLHKERYNKDQVDFLIGYNPKTDKIYIFPISVLHTNMVFFKPPVMTNKHVMSIDTTKYENAYDYLRN